MGVVSIQHRGHLYVPICMYTPSYVCTPPICPYTLHSSVCLHIPPVHLCSPCTIRCPYVMGLGGICTPHLSWSLLGVHLSGISGLLVHPFASQFISHAICFPSLWIASLLDWMDMDVCYASYCWSFLCVFIMSQAFPTMAMTTTPPVTVVCSGMSSLLSVVTMAPSLMELPTSGQHDVVLPPPLTPRHSRGFIGSNLHLRCLLRLMPIMPGVLHR